MLGVKWHCGEISEQRQGVGFGEFSRRGVRVEGVAELRGHVGDHAEFGNEGLFSSRFLPEIE